MANKAAPTRAGAQRTGSPPLDAAGGERDGLTLIGFENPEDLEQSVHKDRDHRGKFPGSPLSAGGGGRIAGGPDPAKGNTPSHTTEHLDIVVNPKLSLGVDRVNPSPETP